ncbi:MAG TPA: chemotaxis protein CheB, partial [Candidatus Eisenbacteria bacterium]|nr:chemotaxis protein CheB [Candidatus Eisenbacteria bacterium]
MGVGASAGGLEAFTEFLRNIPADTAMAFVLVQHLAPTHDSLLTELLSKTTSLPVSEVMDCTVVSPGHVYVIPPNTGMTILDGTLHLSDRKNVEGRNMSIDVFFRSLAEDRRERAIGVILSGSESDGVLGLEKIKAEGGVTFAQDEGSAKFKDMPRRAAASGIVDFVLPPKEIAEQLSRLPDRLPLPDRRAQDRKIVSPKDEKTLFRVLDLLKLKTGMDFTFYKPSTILRRITRRMVLQRSEDLESYLEWLRGNAAEAQALRKDLLINVTSFFRDPASFEYLKKKVFPAVLKRLPKDAPIRIWVPGCSTGNEAYSIAIALDEFLRGRSVPIQIFATDVSDGAVENARRGAYPDSIRLDVSAKRLERYFHKTDGGYVIKESIRDLCIFATHNLLADPPFSDIDLISCRNVLIYMEPPLQKKAVSFFHYSLKPSGFLMLGGSESVGEFSDYFLPADANQKIYVKKNSPKNKNRLHFTVFGRGQKTSFARDARRLAGTAAGFDARKEARKILSGRASRDGVLVNGEMEIMEFFGHTQPYIRPAPGQASLSLMQMVHENLLPDLCIAIHRAKKDRRPVKKPALPVGKSACVDLEVVPVRSPAREDLYFLILFKDGGKRRSGGKRADAGRLAREVAKLKRELVLAKGSLVAMMREQGGMAEEFRCQNEEIQSSNEEFQSTNEELETAKEELQSANEELTTVNNEMEVRNSELVHTNDDLNNLILSVHTAIILVDGDMRVRRFTAKAGKSMGIVASDIGRRVTDISLGLLIRDLEGFIRSVLESLEQKEKEIEDIQGYWYLMRARPFRRQDGKIDGAVLMFLDIMDIKQSMMQLQDAKTYSESIVETLWEPLVALDSSLRIRSANKSFYSFLKDARQDTSNQLIYDLGSGQWDIPRLRTLLEELLAKNNAFYNFEMEHDFPGI